MDITRQSQERLDWLKSMNAPNLFVVIGTHLENPQLFGQFMSAGAEDSIWDYAYAAGLISKADAAYAKAEEAKEKEEAEENPTS